MREQQAGTAGVGRAEPFSTSKGKSLDRRQARWAPVIPLDWRCGSLAEQVLKMPKALGSALG